MALKIRLCDEFESLGSEGRLETGGAFVIVIIINMALKRQIAGCMGFSAFQKLVLAKWRSKAHKILNCTARGGIVQKDCFQQCRRPAFSVVSIVVKNSNSQPCKTATPPRGLWTNFGVAFARSRHSAAGDFLFGIYFLTIDKWINAS